MSDDYSDIKNETPSTPTTDDLDDTAGSGVPLPSIDKRKAAFAVGAVVVLAVLVWWVRQSRSPGEYDGGEDDEGREYVDLGDDGPTSAIGKPDPRDVGADDDEVLEYLVESGHMDGGEQ
ncbi:hypothetical protein [Salinigranum halophilum]|uniref:hypothetical protein n=1 Tax=Salinigranum halophilum TaxID=2565931 RepID=UPI00115CF30E|nr:hypothetical protein [Salinigranum halophilum]